MRDQFLKLVTLEAWYGLNAKHLDTDAAVERLLERLLPFSPMKATIANFVKGKANIKNIETEDKEKGTTLV